MEWEKIVAVIQKDKLRDVEERLQDLRVNGISFTRGKGSGEYANYSSSDWSVPLAWLEIYCEAARANGIIRAIMDAAHTGSAGDGIVALIPVEKLYRYRIRRRTDRQLRKHGRLISFNHRSRWECCHTRSSIAVGSCLRISLRPVFYLN